MPSYGILLLFRYDLFIPAGSRIPVFGIVFFFSFLLPVLNILFLRWRKVISTMEMDKREERTMPYLSTSVVYIVSFFMLKEILPSPSVKFIMLGSAIGIVITLIANYFYKISAHMVGIGGLLGGVLFLSITMGWHTHYEIMLLFLTAGILAGSRLALDAHNPFEIVTGFFAGFASQAFLLLL